MPDEGQLSAWVARAGRQEAAKLPAGAGMARPCALAGPAQPEVAERGPRRRPENCWQPADELAGSANALPVRQAVSAVGPPGYTPEALWEYGKHQIQEASPDDGSAHEAGDLAQSHRTDPEEAQAALPGH